MNRLATTIVLAALLAAAGLRPASAQIYVDKDASGDNDGTSWTDAYTDLQTAIDNADGSSQLWVAEGVYKPGSEVGDSFTITGSKDGIEVYGGFDATESSRSERDPREHRTILSGDVDDNDDDPDGDGIIEDADDISGDDNAHHVLFLDGTNDKVTSSTVLDGLAVTAGQADGSSSNSVGGGLFCDGRGSGNACSPTLANALFAGNEASDNGGAIFNLGYDGTSSPSITNATFTGNTASRGGAIYNNGSDGTSSPSITNATFTGNTADNRGGAIYNYGSGGTSSPSITNATFTGNAASRNGGAIYNDGSGGTSSPSITNATFTGNDAASRSGGAIYNYEGSPEVANTILWGNSASNSGDEIFNENASATLTYTIIEGGVGGNTDDGGNLNKDPQFADASTPAGADGTYATKDDGVNVGDNSPALDAGNNDEVPTGVDEDITGADRTQDLDGNGTATVNMGAYEVPKEGPPIATTDAPPTVRIRSAELAGTVNPANFETTVTFKYRKTSVSNFESVPAAESPLTGGGDQSVSASVDDLDPDTKYKVKVVASNEEGTTEGILETFTTNSTAAPTAQTGSASSVGGTTADLGGTVNPKGLETTVEARVYPTTNSRDDQVFAASSNPLTGDTGQGVTVTLSGLRPGTEYRARVLATNSKGSVEGSSVTFTTTGDGYTRSITGTDGTGNDAGWRMLALPAADKDRSALEGDLTFSTNSGSILYRWTSGSWAAQTSSSDALPRGRGLMLYFFDDVIDPIDAEGLPLAVSTGSEVQSTDETVSGLGQSETFHLLGNPFDVAFDLSELNLSGQGFQQTVQIWDPSSESYTVITQGDDDEIGAWQGFFVERDPNASTNGTSLTFSTAGKQGGPGTIIGSQAAALADTKRSDEKRLRLGLRLAVLDTTESDTGPPSPKADAAAPSRPVPDSLAAEAAAQSSNESSEAAQVDTIGTGRLGLLLSSGAKPGWDAYEASQLGPPGGGESTVALSSPLERNGEQSPIQRALASEPYPGESAAVTVPVSVRANAAGGQATLRLPDAQREQLPAGWSMRLTDTKTGAQTDLLAERYRFTLEEGAEDKRAGQPSPTESRFRLAVGPRGALPTPDGLALEAPYPNPASGPVTVEYAVPQDKADGAQLQLYDVLGRRVRTVSVTPGPRTQRLDVSGLASGVYILRLTAEGAQQTRKLTVVR